MSNLYDAARAAGVQFEREAEPRDCYVDTGELRLHYLEWGNPHNSVIVLLHGFAQNCHSWDFVSLALCHQFRVIALDARGHGDSDWAADADYSPETHQRDLDKVLDRLALSQATVVGLSMGGRNAYMLASRRPQDVGRLVIVDHGPVANTEGSNRIRRFVNLPDELDSFEEFVQRVHQYNPHRSIEQIQGSLVHHIRQNSNGKWTWKYDKVLRDPDRSRPTVPPEEAWQKLKSIRCPTLLVRGGESDVLSPEVAAEMARAMPDCTYVEVERARHLVPGDNPPGFIDALSNWLSTTQ